MTDYDLNRNPRTNLERLEQPILCQHYGQCSGCAVPSHVGNVDIVRSAKLYFSSTSVRRRRRDVIDQRLDWSVEEGTDDGFYKVVVPSKVTGWRTQAKLAVAPKSSSWAKDGCVFGLYRKGSHSVLEIPDCAVHHPSINVAVEALVNATRKVGTSAFTEDSREGGLRYVQLQVERSTGRVCLTLVWNADNVKDTQPALSRLTKELARLQPDLWHSMWCHCNNGAGNNIFARNPKRWYRLSGPEYVREPIPTSPDFGWMYFTPLTFRQANLNGFDVLASDVARSVPGGSKVCELYAGVGVLGLSALAYHSGTDKPLAWLRCSDENPANPQCFERSVDSLPPAVTGRDSQSSRKSGHDDGVTLADLAAMMTTGKAPSTLQQEQSGDKTSYMAASASQALRSGQALGAQVLIVDPPRKGLEEQVLVELAKPHDPDQPYVESATFLPMDDDKMNWCNDVRLLIYVSCGFEALARDLDKLLSGPGGWLLESATGYVLFPGSDHVETLAILRRD
jgi:23S rRNA (uracil1939-C5)-methyltransferase